MPRQHWTFDSAFDMRCCCIADDSTAGPIASFGDEKASVGEGKQERILAHALGHAHAHEEAIDEGSACTGLLQGLDFHK